MIPFPAFPAASTVIATTGGFLDLADPRADDIRLSDIALALSRLARFTGQGAGVVTIARHSVNCYMEAQARCLPHEVARWALMHDAAEAYVGDVSRPLKDMLPNYRRIEAAVWRAIRLRFGLTVPSAGGLDAVKAIDNLALSTEAAALFPGHDPFPGLPAPGLADFYHIARALPDREAFMVCAAEAGIA